MKAIQIIMLTAFFSVSASLLANTPTEKRDPVEVCSELSGFIRTLANERDSGVDYQQSKTGKNLKKTDESSKIKSDQVIQIVKKTANLKPNVLSNAFGNACMSKENTNTFNTDYYKKFEVCNSYTENEELVFKCVTNLTN